MNDIMVSICCTTYNHEKYINETIDSFLAQKTNFKFEILIHDDASTDLTQSIIREYTSKYPDIIKPIYQKENQYSKIRHVNEFNEKRALGRYIAICEGDDYWIDNQKLQKQVDFMETNPDFSICVHNAFYFSEKKDKIIGNVRPKDEISGLYSSDKIILGGGGLFPTNSMFYRTKFAQNYPSFYYDAPVGDYPKMIYFSLLGNVYYMSDIMSVYRTENSESWSGKHLNKNNQFGQGIIEHNIKIIEMLNRINQYSDEKYHNSINKAIRRLEMNNFVVQRDYSFLKSNLYKEIYSELSVKEKSLIFVQRFLPHLLKMYYFSKEHLHK